ncbi:MAG: hypothetical protein D3914_08630 [Candidatus Electrothrix sp. LOE2]|nr:hypothetical protein [Candidatus Electrothrix sp. LOE2]
MIIDIYLYIYTYMYKAYKDNRSMSAEIRLLFLQEELKRQQIFAGERTEGLRYVCLFQLSFR